MPKNKKIYYLSIICIVVITIYFSFLCFPYFKEIFSFFVNLLAPFLIGFVISFILYPLIDYLVKHKINRRIAVLIISVVFITIIVLMSFLIIPKLTNELKKIFDEIPKIAADISTVIEKLYSKINIDILDFLPSEKEIAAILSKNAEAFMAKILTIMQRIISYIISLILGFVLSIYFMVDFDKIKTFIKDWCYKNDKQKLLVLLVEIKSTLQAYIKGVLLVSICLMISSTIFLSIIKLDYAVILGVIIGLTDIIPYFGPYIGGGIAVAVAFTKSPKVALITAIFVVVQQMVEAWLITPKIQSKNIKTHPILVMLSLLFFGKLLGILGMIIAVPILAILQAFFRVNFSYQKEEKNA